MVSLVKHLPDRYKVHISRDQNICARTNKRKNKEMVALSDLVQKAREAYYLGEEMFGSAFVLQIPTIYLYFEDSLTPVQSPQGTDSFLEALSDDAFVSEYAGPPLAKKRKVERVAPRTRSKERRSAQCPTQAFENYRLITPLTKRKIFMCIRDCSTRNFDFLKQKKSVLPEVTPHANRSLLVHCSKSKVKMTGRMPHWTFIRPLIPIRLPSSLNYMIL